MNFNTDLASEAVDTLQSKNKSYKDYSNIKLIETNINEKLSKEINKKPGDYYLVDISNEDINDSQSLLRIEKFITKLLKKILKKENISFESKGLIVGLGNLNITPDSLGPKVIDKVIVTRHLFELDKENINDDISNVCALSPGVMGTTGIETSDIIKAVIDKISIDYIIVIDALKAMDINRINKTIQITNSGISPGSGVGNRRKELSKDVLGIPVIAIGVPTVVDASSIAINSFYNLINDINYQDIFTKYNNLDVNIKKQIEEDVISSYNNNFIVSLKEVDIDIENLSEVISGAIDHALHF